MILLSKASSQPARSINFKIMVVEFKTGAVSYIPIRYAAAPSAAAATRDSAVSLAATQLLKQSLKQSSLVRPEKVAAAAALVNDRHYPSNAMLNRLAGFLAARL